MVTGSRTAIVVPCYNEAHRFAVARFEQFLSETPVEFIFVDDGSVDNTAAILEKIRSRYPDRVTVIRCPRNRGKAEAVRCGMQAAFEQAVDYAGYWDADLATPLDSVLQLLAVFEGRPELDVVMGSRVKLLGREVRRRASRHYLGRAFATAASIVLHLPVYDTQCGAKLFRTGPITSAVFEESFCSRWVFDVELLARYIRQVGSPSLAARRIYEFPLQEWQDIAGSKVKAKDFIIALRDIVRIQWRYGRSKRPASRLLTAEQRRK